MVGAVQRRLNRCILLWGVALLPLVFWPPLEDAFKLPQTFLLLGILGGLLAWAALPEWIEGDPPIQPWSGPVWGLMVAALACSAAHSWSARPQGVEVLRWVGFAIVALTIPSLIRRGGRVPIQDAMALAGIASAGYSLIQFFWSDLAGGMETRGLRPFSTMGNPDFLAAYLVAVFPLMVARVLRSGSWFWWGGTAVSGAALLIAQSRGAWLGMAAAAVAAPVLWKAGGGALYAPRRLKVLVAVAAVGATVYLGVHAQGRARLAAMFSTGHFDAAGRIMMWKATMGMIRDRPVFGAGPGSYGSIYPGYHARLLAGNPSRPWFYSENAHNDTLQLAAETGILGLGAVIWLLTVFWRLGWKSHRAGDPNALPVLLGLVALAVDAQVNFPWYLLPAQGWFWFSIGWLGAREPKVGIPTTSMGVPGRKLGWLIPAATVLAAAMWGRQLVADGWLKLSGDFVAAGRWPEAYVCAERSWAAWGFWEGRSRVASNASLAAYSAGRMTEAESWARRALADAPELPASWNQLGLVLARQGRLDEAQRACGEAVRLNPHFAEAWHTLGNIAFLRNDLRGAETAWRRALAENPSLDGARASLEGLARSRRR